MEHDIDDTEREATADDDFPVSHPPSEHKKDPIDELE
jgi:hypothetical protein